MRRETRTARHRASRQVGRRLPGVSASVEKGLEPGVPDQYLPFVRGPSVLLDKFPGRHERHARSMHCSPALFIDQYRVLFTKGRTAPLAPSQLGDRAPDDNATVAEFREQTVVFGARAHRTPASGWASKRIRLDRTQPDQAVTARTYWPCSRCELWRTPSPH